MTFPNIEKMQKWLGVILVFLLPLQTRYIFNDPTIGGAPWEEGRISLYAIDLVFLAFAGAHLWRCRFRNFGRCAPLTALFITFVLSLIYALRPDLGIVRLVRMLEGMICFVLILRMTPSARRVLMGSWLIAGIIQSFLALTQFSMQEFPASKWFGLAGLDPGVLGTSVVETTVGRFLRAAGTFPHPNMLAGFLVLGILLSAKCYRHCTHPTQRLIAAIGFFVQQLGLFFTFSRSGVVAWGLGALTLMTHFVYQWTLSQKTPVRKLWQAPVVVAVVLVMWVGLGLQFSDLVTTRIILGTRLEQQSVVEREGSIQDAVQLWLRHPWVGNGIGNATATIAQFRPDRTAYQLEPPHNIIALLLLETGLIGLAVALLLWGQLLWSVLQKPLRTVSFAGLVSMGMLMFLDHYFWTQASGILMFWIAAALFHPSLIREKEKALDKMNVSAKMGTAV